MSLNDARALFFAAAALSCAGALGQTGLTQTGRTLDSDFQISGPGANTAVRQPGSFNSQLYVTGQVTGLSRFRGSVGYVGADQLRLNLPSASLGDFRRESVGLSDVFNMSNMSDYGPAPYYERSATVLGGQALSSDLAQPGITIPRTAVPPGLTTRLYAQAVAEYRPLLAPPPRVSVSALSTAGLSPVGSVMTDQMSGRPSSGALFAIPRAQQREQLVRELQELAISQQQAEAPTTEGLSLPAGQAPEAAGQAKPTPLPSGILPALGAKEGVSSPAGQAPEAFRPPQAEPEPNQDVYFDLLIRLRQQHRSEQRASARRPSWQGEGPAVPALPEPGEPLQEPGLAADRLPAASGAVKALVEIEPSRNVLVIHGLAGVSKDLFNTSMARAEKKLKAGKFYEAVGEYELSIAADPNNPLARVGLGLARFGAGEPLSAALQLEKAMQLLPPIMETKLDVLSMLDRDVIKVELHRIDTRMAEGSPVEPRLAFLSAFMHRNMGSEDQARISARSLLTVAGDDELMSTYATFVLTGRRAGGKDTLTTSPAR